MSDIYDIYADLIDENIFNDIQEENDAYFGCSEYKGFMEEWD